jgi:hypothetical protein
MARSSRAEFTKPVQTTSAERAGYICSNPDCRASTVGPHSDPQKSLKVGEVAHIKAAAPGGPRFDPDQSEDERRDIQNALWLCSKCARLIDKDQVRFTVDVLRAWKEQHEEWVRDGGIIPRLPAIELKTLRGLIVPESPGSVEIAADDDLRQHLLTFQNIADTAIFGIDAEVQLPEPVVDAAGKWSAGVSVGWKPRRLTMVFSGSPGASITRNRPPLPSNAYQLQIDRLLPGQTVEVAFQTSKKTWREVDFSFESPIWRGFNDESTSSYHLDGHFQFDYRGAIHTKKLFAPIKYDQSTRAFSVIEVLDDYGNWKRAKAVFWS